MLEIPLKTPEKPLIKAFITWMKITFLNRSYLKLRKLRNAVD